MTTFKGFASLVLAASIATTLSAETHCPGNAASVSLRFANGYQMIVSVSVNHSGPYNFLLDTGTQFTMVDPSLARELRLSGQGTVPVDGTGFRTSASTAQLDQLEVGSHAVGHMEVVLYDLQNLKSIDLKIRGILGEDFLEHFDMLIDNAHKMLCLDESGTMRAEVKGAHIPLASPSDGDDVPPNSLIVPVRLSGAGRPLRLKLDSGANAPVLYDASQYMAIAQLRNAAVRVSGTNGAQRSIVALPAQNMRIGSLYLEKVSVFTLAGGQDSSTSGFDGLLTMGLFRSVFICHAEHFAVLEAR